MEPESSDKVNKNFSNFLKQIDKKLILLFLVFFLVVVAIFYCNNKMNKELKSLFPPLPTKKPVSPFITLNFEETKPYVKVGKETIYGQDLNKMLLYFYPDYFSTPEIPKEVQEAVFQKAIEQSIMLQEAEEKGWITLTEEVFNSPNKDYRKRNPLVATAEAKIRENNLRVVEGRFVSIWFYNVDPPTIGVERAREIAQRKIEEIYPKLVSGEMTFEDAGWQLYRDEEAIRLTEPRAGGIPEHMVVLPENGVFYGKFYVGGERTGGMAFHPENKHLEERIRQMKKGEISEILVGKDGNYYEGQGYYDAFFVVFTVDKIKNKQNPETLQSWLETKKQAINIIYY